MTELETLVAKHRRNGLLIDTNLLLVYLVGLTDERRIPNFGRTQQYTIPEFRLLARFIRNFKTLFTTPHILTEVSNLANLRQPELGSFRHRFKTLIDNSQEVLEPSSLVAQHPVFLPLGLADSGIAVAAKRPMLVLTDDLELHRMLLRCDTDSINFNHIRTHAW